MFGLSTEKFVILAIIALFVLGPERLPHYAAQLAKLVKQLRRMVDGAKNQLASEMGDEFNDVDWRKLDPRQYDPRRIIRDALIEDPIRPVGPLPKTMMADVHPAAAVAGATSSGAVGTVAAASTGPAAQVALAVGEAPPFDSEST
jgi:Sec-independent protein translocase protein TatA